MPQSESSFLMTLLKAITSQFEGSGGRPYFTQSLRGGLGLLAPLNLPWLFYDVGPSDLSSPALYIKRMY